MTQTEDDHNKIELSYQQLVSKGKLLFLCLLYFVFLVAFFACKRAINPAYDEQKDLWWWICLYMAFVVVPVCALLRLDKNSITTILKGTLSYRRSILDGLKFGILNFLVSICGLVALNAAHAQATAPHAQAPVSLSVADIAFGLLYGGILVPFSEEIIFQGWLQTRLQKIMRPMLAASITTLFFFLVHGPTLDPREGCRAINLFVYAIIRMRTKSLLSCFIAHALTNTGLFVVMLGNPNAFSFWCWWKLH